MNEGIKLALVITTCIFCFGVVLIPVHEALHLIIDQMEGEQIIGVHFFDQYSFDNNCFAGVTAIYATGTGLPFFIEEGIVDIIHIMLASFLTAAVVRRIFLKGGKNDEHAPEQ